MATKAQYEQLHNQYKRLLAENEQLRAENEQLKAKKAKSLLAGLICPGCGKPADEGEHSILCF